MEKEEQVVEEKFIKKIKIPLINTICLLIVLLFYLLEPILPIIFTKWIFIVGMILGVVPVILQCIFLKVKNEKVLKVTRIYNEYYQVLLIAVIVVECFFTFIMFPATVQQTSMVPTLAPDDNLLVMRSHHIENNDIIVFRYDEDIQKANVGVDDDELLIKRAIVLPGQTFEYKDNKLFIDNKEIQDEFFVNEMNGLNLEEICKINGMEEECKTDDGKYVLPKGWYVVFGDNRQYTYGGTIPISIDSRTFGLVHESQIYGRVDYIMRTLFNWDKI